MLENKDLKNFLWIVPGIIAFFIALIPTLTYQWPLSLDIYYHIHIAHVYSQYGLIFIDPLVDPPSGTPISYPPLFSLLLMFLGTVLKIDYFLVARILQPIFAMSVVLSVSYVTKKFYGDIAGMSAGFLLLSSYLFSRLVSPLPETMALIFVPLAVYLYYKSIVSKNYNYALHIEFFIFTGNINSSSHYITTVSSHNCNNSGCGNYTERKTFYNYICSIFILTPNYWVNRIYCCVNNGAELRE